VRILIVDDQAVNRQELNDMVSGFGYSTLTVESGMEAILVYPSFQPDIVLLDVLMPGLKGDEIAPQLKSFAGEVHLPIIFITALDDKRTLLRCLEAGGDDFVSKPFDPLILSAKLRAHMRTRKLSQSLEEKNRSLAYFNSRVEREYRIVQHIFKNALTKNLRGYPHLASLFMPLSVFNGDVLLSAQGPLGNLYLFLGDFTGHGLAAAIGTLPTSQTFFTMASRGSPVSEIVREINNRLTQLLPEDMFCAGVLIELSASGERLTYWNGGLNPPMLISEDGQIMRELAPQHVALGIHQDEEFDSGVIALSVESGSRVIMCTDGLTELGQRSHQMLGMQGVVDLFQARNFDFSQVKNDIQALTQRWQQNDDITLAMITCAESQLSAQRNMSELSTMPFELHVRLNVEQIRTHDPVARIIRALEQIEGFRPHTTSIFTLMSEVYSNAVDHSLLELDSRLKQSYEGFEQYYIEREKRLQALVGGYVEIHVEFEPIEKKLHFLVRDSGRGFLQPIQEHFAHVNELSFGRGLNLVEALAEKVEWLESGKAIRVVYALEVAG